MAARKRWPCWMKAEAPAASIPRIWSAFSVRLSKNGPECLFERQAVRLPPSRIRQFEMSAVPLCASLCALHIGCDGANNGDDDFRFELPNRGGESRFALRARKPALFCGQVVDGVSA